MFQHSERPLTMAEDRARVHRQVKQLTCYDFLPMERIMENPFYIHWFNSAVMMYDASVSTNYNLNRNVSFMFKKCFDIVQAWCKKKNWTLICLCCIMMFRWINEQLGIQTFWVIQHLLRWKLLLLWYLRQEKVRVRVMIGFLVRGKVRIEIWIRVRIGVTFKAIV